MAYFQEYQSAVTEPILSRRRVLRCGALAVAAGLAPLPGFAQWRRDTPAVRRRQPPTVTTARRGESPGRRLQQDPMASGYHPAQQISAHHDEPAATLHAAVRPEKALALYNPRTGEEVRAVYWFRGTYLADALRDFAYLLRDYRTNEIKPIDPELLDLLYTLQTRLETEAPFHVMSGYRSPSTNAMLRMASTRVAKQSLHIEGQAVDISVPGRRAAEVGRAAIALQVGGVGYYSGANFVHVDTGRVRYW